MVSDFLTLYEYEYWITSVCEIPAVFLQKKQHTQRNLFVAPNFVWIVRWFHVVSFST